MADIESFKKWYPSYFNAMRAADQDVLRRTLPESIADDHFEFLLQMFQGMTEGLTAEDGEVTDKGDHINVYYVIQEEDGVTELDRPFYFHEGQWVGYDPANPEI